MRVPRIPRWRVGGWGALDWRSGRYAATSCPPAGVNSSTRWPSRSRTDGVAPAGDVSRLDCDRAARSDQHGNDSVNGVDLEPEARPGRRRLARGERVDLEDQTTYH